MLYTVSPSAGDDIALTCVVVILGNRTPFVVLETSSKDEAFGAVVPIPKFLDVLIVTATALFWINCTCVFESEPILVSLPDCWNIAAPPFVSFKNK